MARRRLGSLESLKSGTYAGAPPSEVQRVKLWDRLSLKAKVRQEATGQVSVFEATGRELSECRKEEAENPPPLSRGASRVLGITTKSGSLVAPAPKAVATNPKEAVTLSQRAGAAEQAAETKTRKRRCSPSVS
ncbi:unnamed protein product [Prorocentrum cordatum]|uniref:Uncharacterized protein n=1 Tax=Prorocentrum cordatum TaxID=2364126 RepID=A0ABN9UXG5_9DINO|nr:unnamed protein product [Polarella glacialis]